MTCSPIKNVKVNAFIVLILIVIFVLSIALVTIFSLPKIIWQSVFFVIAVIFCELCVKYFLPQYTYTLNSESFIITKTLNNKTITVCNIDIDRIVEIYTREKYKKQESYQPKSIYNYNGNLATDSCYVLIFEYSNCSEAVCFEPSKEMADSILSLIKSR